MVASGFIVIAGTILAGACIVVWFVVARTIKETETACGNEISYSVLCLMDGERDGMIYVPAVSSITFYDGKVDIRSLRIKVKQILQLNPWLCSRLVHNKKYSKNMVAVYPTECGCETDVDSVFQVVSDPMLSRTMPFEVMSRRVAQYFAAKGSEALNKNLTQFKITLIEITKDETYALLVSLSHVLGDGQTFYHVYSMLDMNTSATALIATRNHDFFPLVFKTCGAKLQHWLTSPLFIVGILSTLFFRSAPKTAIYTVNVNEINKLKNEFKSNSASTAVEYISTNDILTSWYFKFCRTAYGLMAINFRNRFPEYTDSHAGNYESVLLYSREDSAQPIDIRRSLTSYRNKSGNVPNTLESLQFDVSIISNWTSFYKHVSLGNDCALALHLPLLSMTDMIFRNFGVIFNLNESQLGLLLCCRNVDVDVIVKENLMCSGANREVDILAKKVI